MLRTNINIAAIRAGNFAVAGSMGRSRLLRIRASMRVPFFIVEAFANLNAAFG